MNTSCAKGQALRNTTRIASQISDTYHHRMAVLFMLYYCYYAVSALRWVPKCGALPES